MGTTKVCSPRYNRVTGYCLPYRDGTPLSMTDKEYDDMSTCNEVTQEITCPDCEGDGTIDDTCGYCCGSGMGQSSPESTCYTCKGSGASLTECETCNGYGTVENEEFD